MGAAEAGGVSGARGALAALALVAGSLALTLVLLEAALRWIPGLLPTGSYGAGSYDPELEMNTYAAPVIYNKIRHVLNVPNRAGFMDVDHARAKPPGTLRLGIFGDSYVESLQVPLEQTFFRRLPERIDGVALEPLAFGVSGWGTVHSLLTARVQAPRYDLDVVLYVFVENDPGDSSLRVQRALGQMASPKPYADLGAGGGFELAWLARPDRASPLRRLAKLVQAHSLVAQLVWHRVYMLRNRGIAARADRDAAEMTERADGLPNPNALPTTWPTEMRAHAEELGRRVLARFAAEMRDAGRHFAVLYVPRGEAQLRGEVDVSETWRPWLARTCAGLDVPLVDPSEALRARLARGDSVYDDHWTPAGHEVVAREIARYLERWTAERGSF